jgi:hypothetical protein
MNDRINEAALCRKRDEWFAKLQDFFDGKTADPRGFRMLGTTANVGINVCNDPEGWVDACLEDIARNRAHLIFNDEKFVPVCMMWCWIYGVHFMDKVMGGELYYSHGQCNCAYLKTPVGELQEPDLEGNETFSLALRAARRFAEVGGSFPIFTLPVIASPLNIGINLYGQELLVAMLEEPEAARRDLETINRTLIRAHRLLQNIIPRQQLQCSLADSRTQPPGYGQICGCSTQLLSGELYREMVADLDDALLGAYEKGGMIHLCGGHTQHIEAFREMKNLKTVQLNDRAAGDLEQYFTGLREDQIIYLNPCPEMSVERALEITKGERLVIVG